MSSDAICTVPKKKHDTVYSDSNGDIKTHYVLDAAAREKVVNGIFVEDRVFTRGKARARLLKL